MMPCALRFTKGDKKEALEIIKEAALWLEEKRERLWFSSDINNEKITNAEDEFIVLWEKDKSAAAMILDRRSSGMWEEDGQSAYIHKLAVRREFAGQGYSKKMIEYAVDFCRQNGIRFLRLDCDAKRKKLCALYEQAGFLRTDTRQFLDTKYGDLLVAYYQMDVSRETQFFIRWDGREFWRVFMGDNHIMSQANIEDAYDFVKGYMFDYIPSRLTIENKEGTISAVEMLPPRWIF